LSLRPSEFREKPKDMVMYAMYKAGEKGNEPKRMTIIIKKAQEGGLQARRRRRKPRTLIIMHYIS
jgi:hypothetical protein